MVKAADRSSGINLEHLPSPGNRFTLGNVIGSGVNGTVHEAIDNENGGKSVAIKIQKTSTDFIDDIKEECEILQNLPEHPNLPLFYGAFLNGDEVWIVQEFCGGGCVIDLIKALNEGNRHLSEEHLAFILKETVQAICHLHKNHIMHRDIKGNNILFTTEGDIKLIDFGLSRKINHTLDRRNSCVGSPCWMAPELITSDQSKGESNSYDSRIDVWALGILAIELADGKAPFEDMHPSRAIFQIVRNPPPTFSMPSRWSQLYLDFVSECLTKIPDERPFIFEFLEHPFLTSLPENNMHLGKELVVLLSTVKEFMPSVKKSEVLLRNGGLQKKSTEPLDTLVIEDLAALDNITEESIINVIQDRYKKDMFYTFSGDILLFVNPNKYLDIYGSKYHYKYRSSSRSDNAPHIYSVADGAYQDMFHHNEPQHIVLTGETSSGKTSNYLHLLDHILFLGGNGIKLGEKIRSIAKIIHAFGNAATPNNPNSTRHILNTQVTFTKTGKLSGAIFGLYQLEKLRVTGNKNQLINNFHIFYYLYDGLNAKNSLKDYYLESGTNYEYLIRRNNAKTDISSGACNNPNKNAQQHEEIFNILIEKLEFEAKQVDTIKKILAAILLIGEIKFTPSTEIDNTDLVTKIAALLSLEEKKLSWSLCNYCVVHKGTAVQKKHSYIEAEEAKHVFARGLYTRLVDWIVNIINLKLSLSRVIMGDQYYISILDIPGFEIYEQNGLEQLFINTLNEQMQYFYSQKIFALELKEQEEEGIILPAVQYYDNRPTIDELMGKPDGLLYVIDEASRANGGHSFIIETLSHSACCTRVRKATSSSFTVAHYVKKVEYNAREMHVKNHDFLPPELIETLASSTNLIIRQFFSNAFTRSGNLTISSEQNIMVFTGKRKKWGAALISGDTKSRKFNTEEYGEYSQTRRMRTLSSIFRASSSELLKMGMDEYGNVHFVRCMRSSSHGMSGFEQDIISIQLRSLGVVDSSKNRQKGYSYRLTFDDFIERYQYLAFDFDEEVAVTRENCRLLLIRLKLEGWIIGKNKVFLRYYDKEYLSRLYETHVKKITKIQAMMRTFITKRKIVPRLQSQQSIGNS